MSTRYWMAAISKEHTQKGVQGGFIQVCHGKQAPLKRMKKGDFLIVYSSKVAMGGDEKCQTFTALGQVKDDNVYLFEMSLAFKPYRRNIEFFPIDEVPIQPLIGDLEFIVNKKAWGYPFRFGLFEIQEKDFNLITSKMNVFEKT